MWNELVTITVIQDAGLSGETCGTVPGTGKYELVNLAWTESGSKVLVTDCMVNLFEYLQNDRPRREIAAEWKLLQAASRLEQAHNVLILIVTRSANIQTFAITRFILWLQTACCTFIIYRNLFTLYSNEGKQWLIMCLVGKETVKDNVWMTAHNSNDLTINNTM